MPKLNQIIAIQAGKKTQAKDTITQAYHQLKKPELLPPTSPGPDDDVPEDVLGALERVCHGLSWGADSIKVLVHVADAPGHSHGAGFQSRLYRGPRLPLVAPRAPSDRYLR